MGKKSLMTLQGVLLKPGTKMMIIYCIIFLLETFFSARRSFCQSPTIFLLRDANEAFGPNPPHGS